MDDQQQKLTRYLLEDLSEDERTALEEAYFRDPRLFDELAATESALLDDYVRGRLTSQRRQRFESVYLSDPRRRERVKFAEALVSRVDREPQATADRKIAGASGWLSWLRGPRLAVAFASVLLLATGLWFVINPRWQDPFDSAQGRPPFDSAQGKPSIATAPGPPAPPVAQPPIGEPGPGRQLSVVALSLLVGPGQRATETSVPTLAVPTGTDQVRLDLTLREPGYQRYRAVLRRLGGAEAFRQGDLVPAATGPSFTLTIPASQVPPGDYMLTLQGATAGGFEDLSQSLFRVQR